MDAMDSHTMFEHDDTPQPDGVELTPEVPTPDAPVPLANDAEAEASPVVPAANEAAEQATDGAEPRVDVVRELTDEPASQVEVLQPTEQRPAVVVPPQPQEAPSQWEQQAFGPAYQAPQPVEGQAYQSHTPAAQRPMSQPVAPQQVAPQQGYPRPVSQASRQAAQAQQAPYADPYQQQRATAAPTRPYEGQAQQPTQAQQQAYVRQSQGTYAQGSYTDPYPPSDQTRYRTAPQEPATARRSARRPAAYVGNQRVGNERRAVEAEVETTQKPRKSWTGLKSALAGLAGGIVGSAAVALALGTTGVIGTNATTSASSAPAASGGTTNITAKNVETEVAKAVAQKDLPSVVSVYVTTAEGAGMGSGVILDTEGNILTNNHVAGDAESISVNIGNKSYDAVVVGTDASSDLAVIKADLGGDTVTPIEVGDSDALVVGDWVATIGSPFGLDQSVSAGIVSSLSRNQLMQSATGNTLYVNLIQTDASINPGNSGGALVNEEGKLVGISTLFSSDTESFAGIGFAIPGNYAIDVANKIIAGEQVTHAYIGLSMQTVNAQNAQSNRLSVNQGAYVAEVTEGSPADKAGIEKGDIITKMGDEDITSADGMILAVRSHKIGETVKVTVMRGDEEKTFDVELGSDEELQKQQQEELERQQQQYEDQGYGFGPGDGYGYGYGDEGNGFSWEDLWRYLYENNRGGSYELSE